MRTQFGVDGSMSEATRERDCISDNLAALYEKNDFAQHHRTRQYLEEHRASGNLNYVTM